MLDDDIMDKKDVIPSIQYVPALINMFTNPYSKKVLLIYLFVILDIPCVNRILITNQKLKSSLKLHTIISTYKNDTTFVSYMAGTFVVNKRFYNKQKNVEYKKRMFRIFMKVVVFVNRWFYDMIDIRYAPGGPGYFEALNDFNFHMNALSC